MLLRPLQQWNLVFGGGKTPRKCRHKIVFGIRWTRDGKELKVSQALEKVDKPRQKKMEKVEALPKLLGGIGKELETIAKGNKTTIKRPSEKMVQ